MRHNPEGRRGRIWPLNVEQSDARLPQFNMSKLRSRKPRPHENAACPRVTCTMSEHVGIDEPWRQRGRGGSLEGSEYDKQKLPSTSDPR